MGAKARENLKRIIYGGDVLKSYPSAANFAAVEEFSVLDDTTTSYDDEQLVNENRRAADTSARDSFRVHAIISATLVIVIAIIGSLVSDLEVVFGLIGSTCTPIISYILPAMVYLKSGAAAAGQDLLSARLALGAGYFLVPFGLTIWILSQMGKLESE